jgi:hypothetical protein
MKKSVLLVLVVGVIACSSPAFAQSDTEKEVMQTIIEGSEYTNKNLKGRPDDYSKEGALEFWSNGGLLEEIAPTGRPEEFEAFNVQPKHIRVITLVEGQAAVAHYYSEGMLKPNGSPAVSHYLTRVTQVYVKEDGKWKIRSSHWSPITGGGGTTQAAQEQQ